MSNFRFWATVSSAFLLAFWGVWTAPIFPLPTPFTLLQTQVVYALLGFLAGLLLYAHFASWVARNTRYLVKLLVSRLALELLNQFTQFASRGWTSLPLPGSKHKGEGKEAMPFGGAIILDTSTIIDGRILDVGKTGFLSGLILIPNFVLTELQQVADSADDLKRVRGRRGFEVAQELKKISGIKVEIWDKEVVGKSVDDKLVRLGKILGGKIITCDFNLNRVASLSGVRVLNLNELANSLKSLPVPGERFNVKLIHPGKDQSQGVGYLMDGTMVVVKEAVSLVGKEVEVEVSKILQGPAGRMVFGKVSA